MNRTTIRRRALLSPPLSRAIPAALALLVAAPGPARAQPPASTPPPSDAASELQRAFAAEVGIPGGLTADQVAARALAYSPSAAARRADIAIAASELSSTRLEFLPRLALTGRYTRLSPTGASSIEGLPVPVTLPGALENQWYFAAQLAVPLSDYVLRLAHAVASRRHAVRADEWMSTAEKRQAAAEARLAYYDWARARLGVLVADRARAQAAQHRTLAERRLAASSATRADLLLAEARLADSEQLVTRADLDRRLAERRLRVLIGDTGSAPLSIGEDVLAPLPPRAGGQAAEPIIASALVTRPELRALGDNASAIAAQARLERARFFPRLDLVATLARENPNARAFPQTDDFDTVWDLSGVLTWELDDLPRAREKRRELAARRRRLDEDRRQLIDGIVLEVTRASQEVSAAEKLIATSQSGLAAAEEAHRVRLRLFDVGTASSTELGDAETDLTRARFAVLDAHISLRKSRVALDRAAGR